jgi:DNA-directed RNA polymerase specialized sigma24 family protein
MVATMSGTALMAFDDLDVEALAVIANESAEQVESSARKTVEHAERCGRALLAAKEKVPHGQWLGWLAKSFDYSQVTASQYMRIANYKHASNLHSATSIRDALRLIADDPESTKRERKPSVEVIEPIEAEAKPILNDPRLPQPKPEKTQGETATDAVHREETRKAPAHRPPENFTPVTPSYADEDEEPPDIAELFAGVKDEFRVLLIEIPAKHRRSVMRQVYEQLSQEEVESW